jgi:hypothetical protein
MAPCQHHFLRCNRTKREGRELKGRSLPSSVPELWRWGLPLQVFSSSNNGGSHFKHSQALMMVAPTSSSDDGVSAKWGEVGRRGKVGGGGK